MADHIYEGIEATYKVNGNKNEVAQGIRYINKKNSDVSSWVMAASDRHMNLGGDENQEHKLLTVVAEIFQQQNYFEGDGKTKQFEHDQSESFKSNDNSNEEIKGEDKEKQEPGNTISYSKSETNQSSHCKSTSVISNADSFKQGGLEENLSGLSSKVYMPKSYKQLRVLVMCLIGLSMISTAVVLIYDYIFNKDLASSIYQQHLVYSLDSIVLKSSIGLQLVHVAERRNFRYAEILNYFGNVYSQDELNISKMRAEINFDGHQIGQDIAIQMIGNPALPVRYQSYSEVNEIAFVELYEIYSNFLRLYHSNQKANQTFSIKDSPFAYFTFKNLNQVLVGVAGHLGWTWSSFLTSHSRNLILILVGALILSIAFSSWLLIQISRCYDYINHVYGLMVGFSPSVLSSHKSFVKELSSIMENKIDDKKIRKKSRKSIQRSEDNRRHDLGLKTTVKTLQEIPKPKAGMIVGMATLILLVCGFNGLVLFNMRIFNNESRYVLELDEYFQQAHITVYAATLAKISKVDLPRSTFQVRFRRISIRTECN